MSVVACVAIKAPVAFWASGIAQDRPLYKQEVAMVHAKSGLTLNS